MRGRSTRFWIAAAALIMATAGLTGAIAVAASPSSTTFYACLKGGSLSKVSTSTAPSCARGFKSVSWSAVGPQGIQGQRGIQGVQGEAGLGFQPTLTWTSGSALPTPPATLCSDLGVGAFTNGCENATFVATRPLPADAADYQPGSASQVCVNGPTSATIGNASGVPLYWSYGIWIYHNSTATLVASAWFGNGSGPPPSCVGLSGPLALSAGDQIIAGGVAGPLRRWNRPPRTSHRSESGLRPGARQPG